MKIALFADLHGRILMAFKIAERLQRERGIHIDLILQCGDLGTFPDINNLDQATINHARRDKTELGFSRYFVEPQSQVEQLLAKLDCNMICVRGNHEDHDFLDDLENRSQESRFPIDCYNRIWICKTGHLQTFEKGEEQLNFVGIGRVGNRKQDGRTHGKFIQAYEQQALRELEQNPMDIDLLISHDGALHFTTKDFGMQEIRDFLNLHKPIFHFFGHTGQPCCIQPDDNKITESCKIAELEWKDGQNLPYGCLLLLDWQDSFNHKLEIVEDDWLAEYTKSDWEKL